MAHLINTDNLKQEAGNIGNWAWNTWLGNEMNNLVGDNPYLNVLGQLGLNVTNTILNNVALKKQINTSFRTLDANIANKYKTIQQNFETKTGTLNGNPFKITKAPESNSLELIYKQTEIPELYNTTNIPDETNFAKNIPIDNSIPKVESSLDLSPDILSKKSVNTQTSTGQQNTVTNNVGSNLVNGVAGSVAGAGASILTNYLTNRVLGNSKGAQITSGVLGQGAGTAAGAIVSNALAGTAGTTATNALSSAFSSASGLATGGIGLTNLALDVLDPVKKSKAESAANIITGVGSLALTAAIPGIGLPFDTLILAANVAGHLTGQKTENFTANRELLAQAGSSYNSSVNNILKAESLAGQRYSGYNSGGRHKADSNIYTGHQEQKGLEKVLSNIGSLRDILASTAGLVSQQRELESNGGFQNVYTGKEGTILNKISYIDETPSIINELSYIDETPSIIEEFQDQLQSFKEGGSFNIIPEGALHARLHHMEDADNLTKKGIPVVDNNGEQQAEIERNEIIYRISVTKRLEELLKQYENDKYSQKEKDQFAIEAGKLLVQETLYNTVDNTGIIDQVS